jgi:hypothetical protein
MLCGANKAGASLVNIASIQGSILLTVQPGSMEQGSYVNTFSRHSCLRHPLLNPCYILHIGLQFVYILLLNRNEVFRVWNLQMIKIMQMETLNVAVFMPW